MSQNDVLSEIFATLRLTSDLYFRTELSGAWAIEVPAERRRIRFHLVRHGSCWLRVAGSETPVALREGDLAIVPHGTAQILSDQPKRPPATLSEIIATGALDGSGLLTYGSGEGRVRLLCGFCAFDEGIDHPVIGSLPPLVLLSPQRLGAEPWLSETLRLMALEADLAEQGMTGILSRLLEVAFIQVVRRSLVEGAAEGSGYIAALADPRLSKALLAIHQAPERPWTIAALARQSGQSRAVFAARFTAAVGLPPIGYLTSWRLMKARRLLRDSGLAIDEIARRCGYSSLPAFTRRFKAAFGSGPGAFRRARPGP